MEILIWIFSRLFRNQIIGISEARTMEAIHLPVAETKIPAKRMGKMWEKKVAGEGLEDGRVFPMLRPQEALWKALYSSLVKDSYEKGGVLATLELGT